MSSPGFPWYGIGRRARPARIAALIAVTFIGTSPLSRPAPAQSVEPGAHYADVNGLHMYYEIHGAGRPLVLLHGGGSTIETTFARTLPMFAEQHLVIAPEQQGHGHTADIDRPLSFDRMADDTAALLNHLGMREVDVLGFSNGGNVALALAMRYPRLVAKLVVGSVFFDRVGIHPQLVTSFRDANAEKMPAVYRDAYLKVAPEPGNLPSLVDKLMANLLEFDGWSHSEIARLSAPTLILQASNDVSSLEHITDYARSMPDSTLVVTPGRPRHLSRRGARRPARQPRTGARRRDDRRIPG